MEHRWGNRREVSHAVRVRTQGGLVAPGTLRNISVSGALLTTDAPLRLSGHLEVQMFAKSSVVHSLSAAAAHVVRVGPDGFGIEWSELSPPAVHLLNSVLDGQVEEAKARKPARRRQNQNTRRR